jgi:hypothetical protein
MEPNQLSWYLIRFLNSLLPYAVAAVGITLISFTPLGHAAISWLKGHINRGRAAELSAEIEHLRQELAETQERLDFAERHLLNAGAAPSSSYHAPPRKSEPRVPTPV